jgi:hypothetical protein
MALENICGPVILYLGFSLIQIIIDIFKNLYNTAFLKFFVMIIFSVILNILCNMNLTVISWILVFIPFIFMTFITSILLFVFGLSPSSGKSIGSEFDSIVSDVENEINPSIAPAAQPIIPGVPTPRPIIPGVPTPRPIIPGVPTPRPILPGVPTPTPIPAQTPIYQPSINEETASIQPLNPLNPTTTTNTNELCNFQCIKNNCLVDNNLEITSSCIETCNNRCV